jgi:hypothetical protein
MKTYDPTLSPSYVAAFHDIDTITQTVFDMINENGTKGRNC